MENLNYAQKIIVVGMCIATAALVMGLFSMGLFWPPVGALGVGTTIIGAVIYGMTTEVKEYD